MTLLNNVENLVHFGPTKTTPQWFSNGSTAPAYAVCNLPLFPLLFFLRGERMRFLRRSGSSYHRMSQVGGHADQAGYQHQSQGLSGQQLHGLLKQWTSSRHGRGVSHKQDRTKDLGKSNRLDFILTLAFFAPRLRPGLFKKACALDVSRHKLDITVLLLYCCLLPIRCLNI